MCMTVLTELALMAHTIFIDFFSGRRNKVIRGSFESVDLIIGTYSYYVLYSVSTEPIEQYRDL
jgi:hypothetical protein